AAPVQSIEQETRMNVSLKLRPRIDVLVRTGHYASLIEEYAERRGGQGRNRTPAEEVDQFRKYPPSVMRTMKWVDMGMLNALRGAVAAIEDGLKERPPVETTPAETAVVESITSSQQEERKALIDDLKERIKRLGEDGHYKLLKRAFAERFTDEPLTGLTP